MLSIKRFCSIGLGLVAGQYALGRREVLGAYRDPVGCGRSLVAQGSFDYLFGRLGFWDPSVYGSAYRTGMALYRAGSKPDPLPRSKGAGASGPTVDPIARPEGQVARACLQVIVTPTLALPGGGNNKDSPPLARGD